MSNNELLLDENEVEQVKPPLWLLLELTHKCPLECPYCYNQMDFAKIKIKTNWRLSYEIDKRSAVGRMGR